MFNVSLPTFVGATRSNILKMIIIKCFILFYLTAISESDTFEEECGLEATHATPLVRQGQRVGENEFPWQVAIFKRNGNQFELLCGGTIVTSKLVITAAHCFSFAPINHTVNVEDYRIVAGSHLSSWTARTLISQTQMVRAVRLGERFGGSLRNFQDDIALVELRSRFSFSNVVRAVCLDLMDEELHNTQTRPGSEGKVAGWGITDSGNPSETLNFLRIPVVGDTDCTAQLLGHPYSYSSFITADKICAGLTNGSAMCPGDSGAGLVFPQQIADTSPPRWYLRGVLSNAKTSYNLNNSCQVNVVALYTSIFKHRAWLSTHMEELEPQEGCRVRGSAGVCREFSECLPAKREAFLGILPQFCSPTNTKVCCVMVVTCPPLPPSIVSQRKTGSKANDYCIELAEKIHPCQETRFGWTRGDMCLHTQDSNIEYHLTPMTTAAEAPYYGRIGSGRRGNIAWTECPVTLVNDRWVLCAARAIEYLSSSKVQFVGLGGTFQPSYNPDEIFGVAKQFPHPLYNDDYSIVYNNIALLQLDREVTFTGKILPACLHTGTPLPNRGFIRTASDSSSTPDYKMTMERLSAEECSRVVPTGMSWHPDGFKHDVEICSRPVNTTGECPYWYSGSPLTLPNSPRVACTHLLVGLGSIRNSSSCIYTYTRISAFIPWIEGIVWPESGVVFN